MEKYVSTLLVVIRRESIDEMNHLVESGVYVNEYTYVRSADGPVFCVRNRNVEYK